MVYCCDFKSFFCMYTHIFGHCKCWLYMCILERRYQRGKALPESLPSSDESRMYRPNQAQPTHPVAVAPCFTKGALSIRMPSPRQPAKKKRGLVSYVDFFFLIYNY